MNPAMFELTVEDHFDSAHRLAGYPGECAEIHGHTWRVSVTVTGDRLGDVGLSIDFKDIAAVLSRVVRRYDHRFLNDLEEFRDINPTAEHLAREMFGKLSAELDGDGARVTAVTVGEGNRYRLTYRGPAK